MTPGEYEHRLARELAGVGIRGSLRRRILDEIADHLGCDPEAALGEPREIAADFANQLGTARTRTAATAAFASLVVAGALFGTAWALAGGPVRRFEPAGANVTWWALIVAAVATQVALAAGCLAALRPLQRRAATVLPAAEATIIRRRAAVAVGAGIVSMVCLAVFGLSVRSQSGAAWSDLAAIGGAVGAAGLMAAVPSVWRAGRVRPVAPGPAGDITDDLGGLLPRALRGRPWSIAILAAGAIAVALTVVSVPAGDAFDGALRGLLDAFLCLMGFATLGRYLGLWSPRRVAE